MSALRRCVALVTLVTATKVAAQTSSAPAPAPAPVPGARDAIAAAAFGVATVGIAPLDQRITAVMRAPELQRNAVLHRASTTFRLIGEPGAIGASAVVYIAGRVDGSPRASELGLRMAESIVTATALNLVVKGVAGRARPYVVADSNSTDFAPGAGFRDRDRASFASGHTATAFAAAAAASSELRHLWPHSSHAFGGAMIAAASFVGVSRVYDDQHWASDVVAGAGIGTLAARAVVHFNRRHPRNTVDRAFLPSAIRSIPVLELRIPLR